MDLFDSHVHLDSQRFNADREQVIARAVSAGVRYMVTCGTDLTTSEVEVSLAAQHKVVYAAVGVHAHEANSIISPASVEGKPLVDEDCLAQVRELAGRPKVVAIGEIGLDYHYDFSPPPVQRAVLQRQLRLARELELPVILHNRESDTDLRCIVDQVPPPAGVLHCFLADEAMAAWALDRGLYIGIAGPITFKNVRHLVSIARQAPLDRLLIETDCPYLAPHPQRGRRNEPAYVAYVAAKLAGVLGLSPEDVAKRTAENARRLFGIAG